ncbi:hypothetical protein LINGRAHAP2_LOCUS1996 [Linum grandiflorum]
MANSSSADLEIEVDLSPMIRVCKNDTVERLVGTQTVPRLYCLTRKPPSNPKTSLTLLTQISKPRSTYLRKPNRVRSFRSWSTTMVVAL